MPLCAPFRRFLKRLPANSASPPPSISSPGQTAISSSYAQNVSPSVSAGMAPPQPSGMTSGVHAAPVVTVSEASSKYPVLAALRNDVIHKSKSNTDRKKYFLPADAIDELVNQSAVVSALREVGIIEEMELNRLTKSILEGRQRLFLVLVQMSYTTKGREHEQLSSLRYDEWDEINDSSLPFLQDGDQFSFGDTDGGDPQVFKPQGWAYNDLALFSLYQWMKDAGEFSEIFDMEALNLQKVLELDSDYIIKPIATYNQGNMRCLLFPWADGGNLATYWEKHDNTRRDKEIVQWIIGQFVGICSALVVLHADGNSGYVIYYNSYIRLILCSRHGDLKPENILLFGDGGNRGCLKIADMGLSTFHESALNTMQRRIIKGKFTDTPSGTFRYEPPEMHKNRPNQNTRSGQYDIWSMGCIMLELLVWLLYGYEAIRKFRAATPQFWETTANGTNYYVSSYVKAFLDVMAEDVGSNNAYWRLLDLVRSRALVVDVSDEYKSSTSHREIAAGLHTKMLEINQSFNDSYETLPALKYPDDDRVMARKSFHYRPDQEDVRLSAGAPRAEGRLSTRSPDQAVQLTASEGVTIAATHFDEIWESYLDNDFARGLFNSLSWDAVKPVERGTPILCFNCNQIDSPRLFKANIDRNELESSSQECALCRLLYTSLPIQGNESPAVISLRQNGSVVGICDGPDLLSIYADIDHNNFQGAPLGLPKLPDHGSREQFLILKEWIRVCDSTHEICRRWDTDESGQKLVSAMPTRLVDLGNPLRLVESGGLKPSPYVALSHCWGKTETLCTTSKSITEFMKSIDFRSLPETFRNAIQVTRGIGIQYLWIDSLCIIQDDQQDWEHESHQMEHVFSLAYCTIGASSSRSSVQGFFPNRYPRPCVQLEIPGIGRLYVCHNIDNFNRDVDLGDLNSRGWVLQERALSRRTIFYTTTQVYWECGAGVHCETLSRLHNPKAAFLGDARFPDSALKYYRDGRQMLVQDLYERYSRLAFTYSSDRPLAILGLERRLARAFGTRGAYGLFGAYFARLLLWRRSGNRLMTRIDQRFGARHRAPTWSWFSKVGAIDYLDLKFRQIDWAEDDFENPLNTPKSSSPTAADTGGVAMILRGQARRLIPPEGGLANCIILDEEKEEDVNFNDLKCVVFGRDKDWTKSRDANYHTLIIRQVAGNLYERAGVASLKAEYVATEGCWVTVR
ncbi:hypothetical protein F4859DRAFT_520201 [Xylaria cf. heliscus]|nr:hypothetical protein F4859DRAFT_520201 [Xylaria cf. heliscus]